MALTPIFSIPYPCSGSTIDCDAPADFTNGIQAALDTVDAIQQQALNMPAAKISESGSQTVAVNTLTVIQFQDETYDNGALADLAVNNDRFTIQQDGIYLVTGWYLSGNPVTTITSQAVALTQNGTVRYRRKDNSGGTGTLMSMQVVGLFDCVAGDAIRMSYLWTGTGGPSAVGFAQLAIRQICPT